MDARKYLELFLTEAREHLDQIARAGREISSGPTPETLHALFRSFHSLKGMAASMEFKALSELAHAVEDLYDAARQGKRPIDPELGEITLDAADLIATLLDEIAASGVASSPTGQLTQRVRALLAAGPEVSPDEADPAPIQGERSGPVPSAREETQAAASSAAAGVPCAPAEAGATPILVQFQVASGAPLPAARAMVALKRLQTLGTVSKCEPDPSSWADEGFAGKVRLTLHSGASAEAIAKEIGSLPDIRACEAERADASRAAAAGTPPPVASTLRVRTDVLDRLMDGVGDLLVASALVEQSLPRTAGSNPAARRLRSAISRLHNDVLEMRMVPFDWIAQRFHQSVRHLAQNLGKKARMEISGADVRMDRAMLEELIDPINHMLRNAIDHGLEEPQARSAAGKPPHGSIRLALEREGEVVRIRLSDDGRGMDTRVIREAAVRKGFVTEDQVRTMSEEEALMLTTIPGFSTAENLSEVSGRGVGMDVVRTRIESLGGHMRIESQMGQGTRIEMRLPLTVAVIDSLLLRLGPDLYAVPIHSVQQTLEVEPEQVQYSAGQAILQWGKRTVHLRALSSILGKGDAGKWERACPAVIYEVDGHTFGLGVDSVIGKRPIVVKPLKHPLENLREYSGATVLESGRIALILDLANLAAI